MTDWIKWNGGECPVAPETMVEVVYRDGTQDRDMANVYPWENHGKIAAIIKYRVVSPADAPEHHKTLRDEFAMAALTGLLAHGQGDAAVKYSYWLADAMLEARKEPRE